MVKIEENTVLVKEKHDLIRKIEEIDKKIAENVSLYKIKNKRK